MNASRIHAAIASPLLAAAAIIAAACSQAPARTEGPPPVPVTTASVTLRDVPIEIRAIGTVEPLSTIEIRAQVGGVLLETHFREGQDVRKGDLLFTLDARPYEAALSSARAVLARDSVQLRTARQDVGRYGALVEKEYVTPEEFDRIRTNADSLEAAVQADEAAVENAEVSLQYCSIHSPIDGRTGQLEVHAGNLVKANSDGPLVTINRISPVYVAFSVPERSLADIQQRMRSGALVVRATVPGGEADPIEGALTFLDNEVDRTTGTVRLKATFPNRDKALWPGQFVDVGLVLGTRTAAAVVPSQALQTGQSGPFVFVVREDETVESRGVAPGLVAGGLTVIESGLSSGETVVTDGQLRLVPGARIISRNAPAAGAPPAAAEREP